jgi:glycosyltransferase involved in cell wall biosynthesis
VTAILRILTITTLYPNAAMPTHALFVENRLRRIVATGKVEALVIAPVPWFPLTHPGFGRYATYAAVPHAEERHGITITHPRFLLIPKIGLTWQPGSYAQSVIREIKRLLADGFRFDLIDSHYVFPDGVAAARLGQIFGKPVVVSARGTDINLLASLPGPKKQIAAAMPRIDRLITVSGALAEGASALGFPAERIAVLRNGVDCDTFRPADGSEWRARTGHAKTVFVSVGNLIAMKGHDIVIRALSSFDGAHLLIAGQGPEHTSLKKLAQTLGMEDRVHLLGTMPQESLKSLYSAADALILASEREGWPNVLLEAMACGTPVVATNVGGIPEIVTAPVAGRIARSRTPDGLADAMRDLLATPIDRAQVRAYAQGYDWEETISKQVALYESVLKASQQDADARRSV